MPSRDSSLQILSQNLHLLSQGKQQVGRWLCDEWACTGASAPRWLQRLLKNAPDVVMGSLSRPEVLFRDLVLELLSQHRSELVRRRRDGDERR